MNKAQQLNNILHGLGKMTERVEGFDARSFARHCEDLDAVEVARLMHSLRLAYDQADHVKKELGKVFDHVRTLTLPDKMDEAGLATMKIAGVGRVTLTSDIRASMPDKDLGYEWLEENGHGDLITDTVNASTLKALLMRMIRDGEEVPEKVFKISPFTRASITKG